MSNNTSEDIIIQLHKLRRTYTNNNSMIEELRNHNIQLNIEIKQLEQRVYNSLIVTTLSQDKQQDIIDGARCFVCGRHATKQCYTCKQDNLPPSFCDMHFNSCHMAERNNHKALWQKVSIKPIVTEKKEPIARMTKDEHLEELRKLIEDITNHGLTPQLLEKSKRLGVHI